MKKNLKVTQLKPAVIGLGYVGLPLAVEMSKIYNVVGFDISNDRVQQLKKGIDITKEISPDELEMQKLTITTDVIFRIMYCML